MLADAKHRVRTPGLVACLVLVAACGVKGPPPSPPPENPDCSFRSGTSCWGLVPRFPPRSVQPADSGSLSAPRPAVLVTRDTF
jgi:hypothetical protein